MATLRVLCSFDRPSTGIAEPSLKNSLEKGLPACGSRARITLGFRLFESVVNRNRTCRVGLISELRMACVMPSKKECLGLLFPPCRKGVATSSSAFGTAIVAKRFGKDGRRVRRSQT